MSLCSEEEGIIRVGVYWLLAVRIRRDWRSQGGREALGINEGYIVEQKLVGTGITSRQGLLPRTSWARAQSRRTTFAALVK